jgi:hypothetical protein
VQGAQAWVRVQWFYLLMTLALELALTMKLA